MPLTSDWINVKEKLPDFGEIVEVRGSDYMGFWKCKAKRLKYKKTPHKKMKPGCWRWVNICNDRLDDQCIDEWKPLCH